MHQVRTVFAALILCTLHVLALAQPDQPVQILELGPPATAPADTSGNVQFIGTATVLIRYQGFTILTDPNFLHKGDHVHLGYGLHAERLTNPALELAQLPPLDLVILSHIHEDHFDRVVQASLPRDVPIVSTQDAVAKLQALGFRKAISLATWEALELRRGQARLSVSAMPGQHGPGLANALLPSVMGSMLDFAALPGQPRYRMYISGDTLIHDAIRLIPHRYPDIDLALLHLGGTRILKMLKVTMDGKDGVQMLRIIAPARAIPIHFDDYDVFKSPLSDFEHEVHAAGLDGKIVYLKRGERYQFAPAAGPAPPE
ncbi:MBL fold metallo-hydrolase [Massilia sp. CF038]|uniref:MBL fold metallo-hydrolase n=1 Tax=Massilia sp. CF038 TaxID=1881045 RepID=UPI00091834E6|nr:MBL fold metallo-hydrolase [Massilia sp. CF038]SHG64517.1 L-ascorbate metabolism protein UlaG, beta-lactamase superfamily [Massilia sp. CF038]